MLYFYNLCLSYFLLVSRRYHWIIIRSVVTSYIVIVFVTLHAGPFADCSWLFLIIACPDWPAPYSCSDAARANSTCELNSDCSGKQKCCRDGCQLHCAGKWLRFVQKVGRRPNNGIEGTGKEGVPQSPLSCFSFPPPPPIPLFLPLPFYVCYAGYQYWPLSTHPSLDKSSSDPSPLP